MKSFFILLAVSIFMFFEKTAYAQSLRVGLMGGGNSYVVLTLL